MKLWKKFLLCLGCLVVIAGLVFAVMFLIKEYKIKQYSSYCGDKIRETLGENIGNVIMTNVTEYSNYINFTGTVSTEGATYEYNCDVYGKDDVNCDTRNIIDDNNLNYGDDDLNYDEFRNLLLQEKIEVSYEVTDKEAISYGWKFLDDSECYDVSWNGEVYINKNPEKDSQGRNINCYNESGEKEGLHILDGFSLFGLMDFNNYINGKKNGTHISIYPNGQEASKGFYKNDETDGDWTTYKRDGSVENVFHYKNGVEVKDMSSNL